MKNRERLYNKLATLAAKKLFEALDEQRKEWETAKPKKEKSDGKTSSK